MKGNEIDKQRQKISEIDVKIIKLLERRFTISRTIGAIKAEKNLAVEDKKREDIIIQQLEKETKTMNPKFLKTLYKLIFTESKKQQKTFDKGQ
jgi:chorismate mutase